MDSVKVVVIFLKDERPSETRSVFFLFLSLQCIYYLYTAIVTTNVHVKVKYTVIVSMVTELYLCCIDNFVSTQTNFNCVFLIFTLPLVKNLLKISTK